MLLAPVALQPFCLSRASLLLFRCIFVADGQVVAKGSNKTNTKRNVRHRVATADSSVMQTLRDVQAASACRRLAMQSWRLWMA